MASVSSRVSMFILKCIFLKMQEADNIQESLFWSLYKVISLPSSEVKKALRVPLTTVIKPLQSLSEK